MLVYDCWELIIKHMDANCRLELSLRCSDLQHIEKQHPLKIRHLHLQSTQLQLNNCHHKFGVVRHLREENSRGGAPYDVEKHGDPESFANKLREERDQRACITYAEVQTTKEKLLTAEKLLRQRLMFAQTPQGFARNEELKEEIISLNLELNVQEQGLTVPPLYSYYLQITRVPDNQEATRYSKVVLGRAVYGKPMSAARDVLLQKLLSRKTIIDRLTLSHKADFGSNFNHPLIKSAKYLEVLYRVQEEDLLKVSNNRAYFSNIAFTPAFVSVLIQNWITKKYPVGRHFAILVKNRRVLRLRAALERQPNVQRKRNPGDRDGDSYIIPVDVNTDLIAYFSGSTINLAVHRKGYVHLR